jgi:hypothetical protein
MRRWLYKGVAPIVCAIVLVVGGCVAPERQPSTMPMPVSRTASAVPTWTLTPTFTPAPTRTFTPLPSPTPTGLHGHIVFVRESKVVMGEGHAFRASNLWTVYPDGSGLEQLTFDWGGIGVHFPDIPPPYIVFASVITAPMEIERIRRVTLPPECNGETFDGLPYCGGFRFSPDGQYLAYSYGEDLCGRGLRILSVSTGDVLLETGRLHYFEWLPDGRALLHTGHCEGSSVSVFEPDSQQLRFLGQVGKRVFAPDGVTFAELTSPYLGWGQSFWVSDTDSWKVVRSEHRWESAREDAVCWTPAGTHLLYSRQVLTYTNFYTVTFGPRQIWSVDSRSGEEVPLLDDSGHHYLLSCTWSGDWLLVREASYHHAWAYPEPDYKVDKGGARCAAYGRDCPVERELALNWRTGEVVPWEQVAVTHTASPTVLPTPTFTPHPMPTPAPTSTPGPDLTKSPIYADPGGAFTLYPGPDAEGLWRVPAQGEPVLLVKDGHHFVYIP